MQGCSQGQSDEAAQGPGTLDNQAVNKNGHRTLNVGAHRKSFEVSRDDRDLKNVLSQQDRAQLFQENHQRSDALCPSSSQLDATFAPWVTFLLCAIM